MFRIPFWRHIYSWLGIVPASAANLRRYLKWGSVGITPGGIAEMYKGGELVTGVVLAVMLQAQQCWLMQQEVFAVVLQSVRWDPTTARQVPCCTVLNMLD